MNQKGSNTAQNEKPRTETGTSTQGKVIKGNGKFNNLSPQKQRWIKGQELYRAGGVSIGKDGHFHVNRYQVDPEKVTCECPDYQNRKQPCKHYYAVATFQKNGKPDNGHLRYREDSSHSKPRNGFQKPQEAHGKDSDRQRVIT